jgi:hypothetical protein
MGRFCLDDCCPRPRQIQYCRLDITRRLTGARRVSSPLKMRFRSHFARQVPPLLLSLHFLRVAACQSSLMRPPRHLPALLPSHLQRPLCLDVGHRSPRARSPFPAVEATPIPRYSSMSSLRRPGLSSRDTVSTLFLLRFSRGLQLTSNF